MSSDEGGTGASTAPANLENGNPTKKVKLQGKDKTNHTEKKSEVQKAKEKEPTKTQKTTTVMSMLRAQRDANILKASSQPSKGSKSTSSATSDDSSSSDSDSSDTSSDAAPSRHSEDDAFNRLNNKAPDAAPPANNKVHVNGNTTSNNIPQDVDVRLLNSLTTNHRDSLSKIVELVKMKKDNFSHPDFVELLYE